MQTNYKKLYVTVASVVISICAIYAASFLYHVRKGPPGDWTGQAFAGRVVDVSTTTRYMSVIDARGHTRKFWIGGRTDVFQGRDTSDLSALAPGTLVLIKTSSGPDGVVVASEIRIMTAGMSNEKKDNR